MLLTNDQKKIQKELKTDIMMLNNKGRLLLALLENDLIEYEIDDAFWQKFDNAWNMFGSLVTEAFKMYNSPINIVG